ncbi:MAG: hypothetical protein LHW48_07765 [Candidatus Cloacimonetes bacterium]|nr:hypothetical protein [Candidatus Cloacimonadota bacterium]
MTQIEMVLLALLYEEEYGSPARKVYFINDGFRETVRDTIKKALHSPQRAKSSSEEKPFLYLANVI